MIFPNSNHPNGYSLNSIIYDSKVSKTTYILFEMAIFQETNKRKSIKIPNELSILFQKVFLKLQTPPKNEPVRNL